MNKKIAMSLLSVFGALTLVTGSAFAAFTTSATATGNTFSTTTPGLQLSVDGRAFGVSVTGIAVSGLIPGAATPNHTFDVYNSDSDTGATQAVSLNFNNNVSSALPGSDTTIVVDCGQGAVSDSYTGWMTGHFIGNVGPGAKMACTMNVTLNSGVPNTDQGLQDLFDGVFTGSIGS